MIQYSIDDFLHFRKPHPAAFEGQKPPDLHIDSPLMEEWYAEQMYYCENGRTVRYKGGTLRLTGDHYWFLNFFPFSVPVLDSRGNALDYFETNFGFYCNIDDYIFKTMEEASQSGMNYGLLGARGFGKSYIAISTLSKMYTMWDDKFHGIVSASSDGHASEAWKKVGDALRDLDRAHPYLAQQAAKSDDRVQAMYKIKLDGREVERGSHNLIEKHIFGYRPGGLKGRRVDYQLWEEFGDWADGPGSLRNCFAATEGIYEVGGIRRAKHVIFTGTGGTIKSKQAKEMYQNWQAFNLYPSYDFSKRGSGVFIPGHFKRQGFWEKTGTNDREGAKADLQKRRDRKETDMELFKKEVQEYPMTLEEAFMIEGTNKFNQKYLADQRMRIEFGEKSEIVTPGRGNLRWTHEDGTSTITGVEWVPSKTGNIYITEHPIKDEKTGKIYDNLYVAGVDSIDQGEGDSVQRGQGSKLGVLIKKRFVDGKHFSTVSNVYVCMYNEREYDVRDNYEVTLKISMYYNAMVNVEYTKIGIITHFKYQGHKHRLMKRPSLATANVRDKQLKNNLIGTQASGPIIDHQDDKIKEYVDDYCHTIWFIDLLEQLQEYDREDRREYDLVVAMGLCELADEDLGGKAAQPPREPASAGYTPMGFYKDKDGKKQYGPIIHRKESELERGLKMHAKNEALPFSWYTSDGEGRFDKDLVTDDKD